MERPRARSSTSCRTSRAMRDHGASGTLESVIPFQTAPAWASYATGALPETHGCFDLVVPGGDGRMRVVRGDDLARHHLLRAARPRRPALGAREPSDRPGRLRGRRDREQLADARRRAADLPARAGASATAACSTRSARCPPTRTTSTRCARVDEARFDLVRELCLHEDWDHFFVLFSATDWLGHAATGRFLSGDDDARQAFLRLYRQLDAHVGWLLEHSGAATAFVISEHGQAEERAILRVNAVLDRLGLVETLPRSAASTRRARRLLPDRRLLRGVRPRRLARRRDRGGARGGRRCPTAAARSRRVWRTGRRAGAPAFAPAGRASGLRPPSRTARSTSPPVAGSAATSARASFSSPGPASRTAALERASLRDLAPTLLWLMGAPLPSTVDGRVIREAFAPNERPIALRGGTASNLSSPPATAMKTRLHEG